VLHVTVGGIIPESHRRGHDKAATLGTILRFVMMAVLEDVFA